MPDAASDYGTPNVVIATAVDSSRPRRAADDLIGGARQWWIWSSMAWQDVRLRYRGSILGPFWLTLSMAIMIAALGVLYSTLFKLEIRTYLPFLTLGLLVWTFISTIVLDGCNCLIAAETIIRQVRMPFSVHVYRTLYRNLIVLAHNAVVYVVVVILFQVPITFDTLMAVPALLVLLVTGAWVCILLGMIGARFRDVGPIVGSLIQVVFFVTPIFWDPATLHGRHMWLVNSNPFYAMVEIVRAPLMGKMASPLCWAIALGIMVGGWIVAFAFFSRFRSRIPFWV